MTAHRSLPRERDHAPWFRARLSSGSPSYAFNTVAGRYIVLLFLGSAGHAPSAGALEIALRNQALFDDQQVAFFGITVDPSDEAQGRIRQQLPGIRFFLDYDRAVSTLYGAATDQQYLPQWMVVGPDLRIVKCLPIHAGEEALAIVRERLAEPKADLWAPVLLVPEVLEPELCRRLLSLCGAQAGGESGFMRDIDGRTVLVVDKSHKQRHDWTIEDGPLRAMLAERLHRLLLPALQRAFQFEATRIERYLVGRYDAGAGHFRPHRDNTTRGTAHRRFAVTINLNADEYEGGDLRFPEFGHRTYRAPTGGAIVFSCSLLHEAMPVTRGSRYAFLPFLYGEEDARIREANNPFLGEGVGAYRAG